MSGSALRYSSCATGGSRIRSKRQAPRAAGGYRHASAARRTPYRKPVIIDPEQIARVLAAASNLLPTPNSPLLPAAMRLAVVILYTAGLRRGELVRLTLDDVEPRTGLLRIRASKFHKSRMVPLSPGARDELRIYLRKRLASQFDSGPHTPLLCNNAGGRQRQCTGGGLGEAIDRLFVTAQVVDSEGRRPRVQDVRHYSGTRIIPAPANQRA